jgi:hypothetical protein
MTAHRRFQLSMQAYTCARHMIECDGLKLSHWLINDVCKEYAEVAQIRGGRNPATGRRLKR